MTSMEKQMEDFLLLEEEYSCVFQPQAGKQGSSNSFFNPGITFSNQGIHFLALLLLDQPLSVSIGQAIF
jgi:hypothetical protein